MKSFFKKVKKQRELILIGLPGFLIMFTMCYIPMGGILIAFKDYNYSKGIWGSEWCGLKNFEFFFKSQYAGRIIRNTLVMNLLFITTVLVGSLLLAFLLKGLMQRKCVFKSLQSAIFFPNMLSYVVIGYIGIAFLDPRNGMINQILLDLGIISKPIQWYFKAEAWPWILMIFNFWKAAGVNTLIYLSAMMDVPAELYEAAAIDGASSRKMAFSITLPAIMPMIISMALINIGQIFRSDFGLFYNVTQNSSMLYSTTDVIDTFILRSLRQLNDVGMSSAAGFVQSVVGLIMVVGANFIVRKFSKENALF